MHGQQNIKIRTMFPPFVSPCHSCVLSPLYQNTQPIAAILFHFHENSGTRKTQSFVTTASRPHPTWHLMHSKGSFLQGTAATAWSWPLAIINNAEVRTSGAKTPLPRVPSWHSQGPVYLLPEQRQFKCFSHTLSSVTLLMDAQQSPQSLKAHKNSGRQDGDMNQAPQWRSTDTGRHRTKFSHHVATTTWLTGSLRPCPILNISSALFNLNTFPWLSFFFWIFWDGSGYKLSWLLPGQTQETHEEFKNGLFLVESFEMRTQVRNILFTTIQWNYVPRSSQLTVGIAMLMMWFIMNGHDRKRLRLLLRYRPGSPVIAQELNSHSGKSFLRNYSRWGCNTVQSDRNLLTHLKSL